MINSIMKIFLPKDRVFYQLFEEVAVKVLEMARKLKEVVHEPDYDKRSAIASQIEELEHVNDDLTHKIFTELGRNFITPFDREDIHYLASALDDRADYIFATSNVAVHELRDMKNLRKITESLVKINSIENQADDIFDMSIERLFATELDAKEVIKKREIYQAMEITTDKCEDAANVIESIIVKYA